ncbi:hypothetical protein [Mucilaginibacter sp. L196]|uniref:hypothetical protein n=1 Tax=Mucilaginibacter sp. L196 TaxID=1641870 RepID=UPI00131B53F0|nr:hypothetical protein [Mucilaginibacter sp. L196]
MAFLRYYMLYLSPASIVIPIIVALLRYKLLNPPFKVLLGFLVFSAIANAVNITLSLHHIPTTIMFHIYTPIEFACISLFYNYLFKGTWQKIMVALVIVLSIFCLVDFLFIQPGIQVDTYPDTVEAIIIIAYSVLYLNQQSNIETNDSWGQSGLNWVNIALLIYYGCGLFMFISINYLLHASVSVNAIVWSVFDTILVVESLLFATGFYKCKT